jgi:hypothetical protein
MSYGASPLELLAAEAMLAGKIYCEGFVNNAVWAGATALGANSSTAIELMVTDKDFVIQEMNLVAYTAGPVLVANPDYLLTIVRGGSGRQLMNQATHVQAICGRYGDTTSGGRRLGFPQLVEHDSVLTLTLTNLSATAALRVDLALLGFKIYYLGNESMRQEIFHIL